MEEEVRAVVVGAWRAEGGVGRKGGESERCWWAKGVDDVEKEVTLTYALVVELDVVEIVEVADLRGNPSVSESD